MKTKNLEEVLRNFNTSMFEPNDIVSGTIIAVDEHGAKIKTSGNCYLNLQAGVMPPMLTEGAFVEVIVSHFVGGDVYVNLSESFTLEKLPHEATIFSLSDRAVLVELIDFPDTYALYRRQADDGLMFTTGDRVLISQMRKENGNYFVGKIEALAVSVPDKMSANKRDEKITTKWTQERINEVFKSGSRKMTGGIKLGHLYQVTPYASKESGEVKFHDGTIGKVADGLRFPAYTAEMTALVTFISKEDNKITVDLISDDNKSVKGRIPQKKNMAVYNAGMANGSLERAGGYYLGFQYYNLRIVNGQPYFKPQLKDEKSLVRKVEVVVNPGQFDFREDESVDVEVTHIEKVEGVDTFRFHVNILKVHIF